MTINDALWEVCEDHWQEANGRYSLRIVHPCGLEGQTPVYRRLCKHDMRNIALRDLEAKMEIRKLEKENERQELEIRQRLEEVSRFISKTRQSICQRTKEIFKLDPNYKIPNF